MESAEHDKTEIAIEEVKKPGSGMTKGPAYYDAPILQQLCRGKPVFVIVEKGCGALPRAYVISKACNYLTHTISLCSFRQMPTKSTFSKKPYFWNETRRFSGKI